MQHNKPILMIHDMREEFFNLPLSDYILTFDDGLFSQWFYLDQLNDIDTDKYFFISTKFISSGKQSLEFPCSVTAHQKARSGNCEDFMTVEQIRQIHHTRRCYIGGHGHTHVRLRELPRLTDKIKCIAEDTKQMLSVFDSLIGIRPTTFCFPYNDDIDGMYPAIVRKFGISTFFGRERIAIESLIDEQRR